MPSTAVQDQWISRVLGIVPTSGPAAIQPTAAVSSARSDAVRVAASVPLTLTRAAPNEPIRYVSVQGRQLWQAAREALADQFGPLQDHLLGSDDTAMQSVATQAYPALMQRLGATMLTAMSEVDAADPERAAAARSAAATVIASQREILASDTLIDLIEANPFGVAVPIRRTLGAALDEIERALNR